MTMVGPEAVHPATGAPPGAGRADPPSRAGAGPRPGAGPRAEGAALPPAGAPAAGAADDSLALSSARRSLLDVRAPQPLATSNASRPTHSGADRCHNRFPMSSP